jgi:hypothetical protein
MQRLVLIMLLAVVHLGIAQEAGYQPGAIVTLENERIEGLVKNVNLVPARILDDIKFKTTQGGEVTSYSPLQISAYETEGNLFVPKKTSSGQYIFVRKFNAGKLKLYGKLVFDGSASYRVVYSPYIQLDKDPVIHAVEQLTFKKQMLSYLKDAPNVCKLISEKELKWRDIEQIVNLYNEEVTSGRNVSPDKK